MVIQEVETTTEYFCGSAISEDYLNPLLPASWKWGKSRESTPTVAWRRLTSSTLLCWMKTDWYYLDAKEAGKGCLSMVPAFQKQLCIKKYSVLYTPNVGGHLTSWCHMILILSFSLFFPSLTALPGISFHRSLDIFLLPILPMISLYSKLSQATDMASSPLHYCQTSWKILYWFIIFLSYWNCSNLMSSMTLLLNLIFSSKP